MKDKYTFRREYTDLYGQTKIVEHTMEGETLPEILEDFLYFLNGCSFTYVRDLIWVKEDGTEEALLDYQADQYNLHRMAGINSAEDLENELINLENKLK
jgi:hypothetical protein